MPYRLIIVDDEKEISNGFAKFFPWSQLGFSVKGQFLNGKEVLNFIKENEVDVIVSDVLMPGMTGIELAKEISVMKLQTKPKLIFFSAYDEFKYAQKAMEYGASQYILKTASYDELIDIFKKLKEKMDEESNISKEEKLESEEDKVLAIIKGYIDQHLEDVNLEALGEKVYMSPHYVSRYFKAKTGKNFQNYLIEQRMKRAALLLGDLQYKIGDISSMVGYTNPFNFTRAFKKYYGITPKDYQIKKLGRIRLDENKGNEL